jgi:mannose-6-phosphate isomerase-like protein (cupin superfamily)
MRIKFTVEIQLPKFIPILLVNFFYTCKSYISSGNTGRLLGILDEKETIHVEKMAVIYPEIKTEITAFQKTLEKYTMAVAEYPSPGLRNNLFDILNNLIKENSLSIGNLPLLNKYSDHKNWLKLVKPMLPDSLEEDMFIKILRNCGNVVQSIVWIKNEYPDEVHNHLKESFIVLEGKCECRIDNKVIKLGPGGFLNIPLYEHYDVKELLMVLYWQ